MEVGLCEAYVVQLSQCDLHPVPHLEATRQAESRDSNSAQKHPHASCLHSRGQKAKETFNIRSWRGKKAQCDLNWKRFSFTLSRAVINNVKILLTNYKRCTNSIFFPFSCFLSWVSSLQWRCFSLSTKPDSKVDKITIFQKLFVSPTIFFQNIFSTIHSWHTALWLYICKVGVGGDWDCLMMLGKQYSGVNARTKLQLQNRTAFSYNDL